jgi:hypothetical protein
VLSNVAEVVAYTVTPTLQVGDCATLPAIPAAAVGAAVAIVDRGERALVPTAEIAAAVLEQLGVPADDALWRARTRPAVTALPRIAVPEPTGSAPRSRRPFDEMFPPDAGPVRPVPFNRAPRSKKLMPHQSELVEEAIELGRTQLVDPRVLLATQTGVTRPGVRFYLGERFARTGDTYQADRDPGNRLPLVYIRDGTDAMILAGHHRATAALIQPLEAIVVAGPWGPSRSQRR